MTRTRVMASPNISAPIGASRTATNPLVITDAVLIVPIGALLFGETITLVRVIGVALCLIGVSLIQR